jgi:hypothetical protein
MRKNIQEFHEGELIRLLACGWQAVKGEPWTDEQGHVLVPIAILGLKFVQILKFDRSDEFEYLQV